MAITSCVMGVCTLKSTHFNRKRHFEGNFKFYFREKEDPSHHLSLKVWTPITGPELFFHPAALPIGFHLDCLPSQKRVWLVARCGPEKRILNLNFKVDLRRLRIDNAQSFPPAAWENQRRSPSNFFSSFANFPSLWIGRVFSHLVQFRAAILMRYRKIASRNALLLWRSWQPSWGMELPKWFRLIYSRIFSKGATAQTAIRPTVGQLIGWVFVVHSPSSRGFWATKTR